ncbi:MAG: acyl carrier protein [Pseudothermotoga sp.]|uniref:acyl carrier protein n=1 Tax=Pseudothermotoga sp. TaxID=2033661 RepID=UPI002A6F0CF7|nr:acyl carrier protein [Pseudothermotoga sp.]MCX7812048.1 acyl carrier protein [Pseudothermotoga sp.]
MNKEELMERIKEIIADKLGVDIDEVTDDADLIDDLDADSLDLVDLAMAIEDEFGVTIADEELEKIRTVRDIFKELYEKIKSAEEEEEADEEE